jgi:hypothetical protein
LSWAKARPSGERSNTMIEIINEQSNISNKQSEVDIFNDVVSDESLEAAAFAEKLRVYYTQFGLCTVSFCPGQ